MPDTHISITHQWRSMALKFDMPGVTREQISLMSQGELGELIGNNDEYLKQQEETEKLRTLKTPDMFIQNKEQLLSYLEKIVKQKELIEFYWRYKSFHDCGWFQFAISNKLELIFNENNINTRAKLEKFFSPPIAKIEAMRRVYTERKNLLKKEGKW